MQHFRVRLLSEHVVWHNTGRMRADELDFELPPELIAQVPAAQRSESRLLHYQRRDCSIAHRTFSELPDLLQRGDLLVFNDSRVVPAKFMMQKVTGGLIEALFLDQRAPNRWHVMMRNLGNYGSKPLSFVDHPELVATMVHCGPAGEYEIELNTDVPAHQVLSQIGRMPLPPYIKRDKQRDERDELDRERYQTVYAKSAGSVAAPTAGLHFTPEILQRLNESGVNRCFVTLHVGMGTFKPVTADTLETHAMHSEAYTIDQSAADALNHAKASGNRIIPVGTTATRVLESQPADAPFSPKSGQTDIFIYPPYPWKHVAGLITNFHLPRSTLIALVAAFVGLDEQRKIYREAINERYRFFSYGDVTFLA